MLPTNVLLIGVITTAIVCIIAILDRISVIIVYSWEALLGTVLLGIVFMYQLIDIITGPRYHGTGIIETLILVAISVYVIGKGLLMSFTGDGIVEEKLERTLHKRACKDLFGKWALIAPRGGIILIYLALIIFGILIPTQWWLFIVLSLVGLVYHVRVNRLIRKHIDREKAKGIVY